jgi:uncharacterized protein YeaC (DUF1315 family)
MDKKPKIKPSVATKLSPEADRQLDAIARKKGMSKFALLQMVCDTIIRYMSDAHNLTPEIEQAMSIFEHMTGWADQMNLADSTVQKEIAQAVYIFQDAEGVKKGFRATMVSKPFMGMWEQTENVMDIFERLFNILMPELYTKLLRARIELGYNTVTEVINVLADGEVIAHMNDEFRKDFEDCARADNGKAYGYGQRTKGHQHRTPDSLAMDQRLQFKDFDRETGKDYDT